MSRMSAAERFWQKVERRGDDECWPWKGTILQSGHGQFWTGKTSLPAHRWLMSQLGHETAGKLVCHRCNNPRCVNPRHLYCGTARDNARDSIIAGTFFFAHPGTGAEHHQAKLTDDAVRAIRAQYDGGKSQRAIARSLSISQSAVSKIVRRETWSHV